MSEQTIWKYEIEITDEVIVQMPVGAKTLTFQSQNDVPCIWALVDPTARQEPHKFRLVGTSHPINMEHISRYVGTAQFHNGTLVIHLFEVL